MTWHEQTVAEVYDALDSTADGLSDAEADRRLEEYGQNQLQEGESVSPLSIFLSQFTETLVYILVVAAALFLGRYLRALLYPVGIVYTAIQFPIWYVANAGAFTLLGYVDKGIQIALIVVLAYLY